MAVIRLNGESVAIPDPTSPDLKVVWDKFDRLPSWIESGPPRQILVSIATELNSWYATAHAKGGPMDLRSAARAAFNAAALGLVVGDTLDHCYFVPIQDKKRKQTTCELWMGYPGFLELGYRSGWLATVTPEVVLDGEDFQRWNDEDGSHYKHPLPLSRQMEFAHVQGAYVNVETTGGARSFTFVDRAELVKLARRGNVWRTAPIPMSHKTAVLRSAKWWRKTKELTAAVKLEEQSERGATQMSIVPEADDEAPLNVEDIEAPEWAAELNGRLEDSKGPKECEKIRREFHAIAGDDQISLVDGMVNDWVEMMAVIPDDVG